MRRFWQEWSPERRDVMNRDELEAGLSELDAALAKAFPGPGTIECLVVGGACLIFQGITDRATQDIDVVIFDLMGSEETTLIFQTPLAGKIRTIIKKVGRKLYGLKGDHSLFFNDNCAPFLLEMSRNVLPDMRLLKSYQKLRLYVPIDLSYILALKLMAGRPQKDHDDIRKLCQHLGVQNRPQAQNVINRYFPSPLDQHHYQLPRTLRELFKE